MNEILLRLPAVRARVGLSRSEVYRRISIGEFPPSIRLGKRARAWTESSIDTYVDELIKAPK